MNTRFHQVMLYREKSEPNETTKIGEQFVQLVN